jgi:hypothetical protein
VRGEPGDLVAKTLGGDDGDILRDALVGGEVERQARVVLLDDDARGLEIETDGEGRSASGTDREHGPHRGEGRVQKP